MQPAENGQRGDLAGPFKRAAFGRILVERSMGLGLVVVTPPCFEAPARFGQTGEPMLVQVFITQPTDERLDEGLLRGFARLNAMSLI